MNTKKNKALVVVPQITFFAASITNMTNHDKLSIRVFVIFVLVSGASFFLFGFNLNVVF